MPPGHLAQAYTDAWNTQDPAAVAAFFAPDGVIVINVGPPWRGRDGVAEMAAGFYADVPDLHLVCDRYRRAGAHAVFLWTFTGTHAGTGAPLSIAGWEEWELDAAGLIARSCGWFDAEDYAAQAQAEAQAEAQAAAAGPESANR